MSRYSNYENSNFVNNPEYSYQIKCKNHKICNGLLPDKWIEVRGKYVCIPCEKNFSKKFNPNNNGNGELKFADNITCLQCNNQGEGVAYPDCKVSLNCTKYSTDHYETSMDYCETSMNDYETSMDYYESSMDYCETYIDKCEHYLCLQCFDNNWYAYNNIPEPLYPYSDEIYEEYYQDHEDEKWKGYPLIDVYYQQMTLWHKLKNEILDRYEPLRKCSVCPCLMTDD